MVRVTDSLLPQIAADFGTTVGEASIVVAAYSFSHGSIQLVIGPVGDRFGKYRTVAVMCALAAVLVAICGTVQSLPSARARAFRLGGGRRLDHSDLDGLCRRRHALRTPATDSRTLSLRPDLRPAVRPGGGRRARRSVRLAQRCSSCLAAMFALATVGLVAELIANPRTPHAALMPKRAARGFAARLRRGAVQSVGALRDSRGVHRGQHRMGRLRLCRSRSAFTLRPELRCDRADRRHVRDRRAHLCRLGPAAGEPARSGGACEVRRGRCSASPMLALAIGAAWWLAPLAVTAIGLGFYALHNTPADPNATQMTPAGARHGRRDLLLGDLSRSDARRGRRSGRVRSIYRRAAVRGGGNRAAIARGCGLR